MKGKTSLQELIKAAVRVLSFPQNSKESLQELTTVTVNSLQFPRVPRPTIGEEKLMERASHWSNRWAKMGKKFDQQQFIEQIELRASVTQSTLNRAIDLQDELEQMKWEASVRAFHGTVQ